jgi:nitrate reductase (cytochrome), electron transfer subunit
MLRPAFFALACFAASVQAQTPPPITHPIDGYLVTRVENNCLECHDKPRDIGKKRAKDAPTPSPKSHYASLEGKPEIAAGHFNCTSCHVKGK